MADLVRQYGGNLFVATRELDQRVGHDQRAARQGKGVRPDDAAGAQLQAVVIAVLQSGGEPCQPLAQLLLARRVQRARAAAHAVERLQGVRAKLRFRLRGNRAGHVLGGEEHAMDDDPP